LASSSVELDDLLLVVGVVAADGLAVETQPRGEAVERLGLVGDRGDLLAQLGLGQEPQQHNRAHHLPELPEGAVEPVLAGVGWSLAFHRPSGVVQ